MSLIIFPAEPFVRNDQLNGYNRNAFRFDGCMMTTIFGNVPTMRLGPDYEFEFQVQFCPPRPFGGRRRRFEKRENWEWI